MSMCKEHMFSDKNWKYSIVFSTTLKHPKSVQEIFFPLSCTAPAISIGYSPWLKSLTTLFFPAAVFHIIVFFCLLMEVLLLVRSDRYHCYERLFLPQFSSPDGEPWWNPPSTPGSQTGRKQSDARPSTGVSSPGSPVSPCTGLGVRMAWFPFG